MTCARACVRVCVCVHKVCVRVTSACFVCAQPLNVADDDLAACMEPIHRAHVRLLTAPRRHEPRVSQTQQRVQADNAQLRAAAQDSAAVLAKAAEQSVALGGKVKTLTDQVDMLLSALGAERIAKEAAEQLAVSQAEHAARAEAGWRAALEGERVAKAESLVALEAKRIAKAEAENSATQLSAVKAEGAGRERSLEARAKALGDRVEQLEASARDKDAALARLAASEGETVEWARALGDTLAQAMASKVEGAERERSLEARAKALGDRVGQLEASARDKDAAVSRLAASEGETLEWARALGDVLAQAMVPKVEGAEKAQAPEAQAGVLGGRVLELEVLARDKEDALARLAADKGKRTVVGQHVAEHVHTGGFTT